eukprot:2819724-Pyramimonas_sp.AAC.1
MPYRFVASRGARVSFAPPLRPTAINGAHPLPKDLKGGIRWGGESVCGGPPPGASCCTPPQIAW